MLEFLEKNVSGEKQILVSSSTKDLIERLRKVDPNSVISDYVSLEDNSSSLSILGESFPAISIENKSTDEIVEVYESYIDTACKKSNITNDQIVETANKFFTVQDINVMSM